MAQFREKGRAVTAEQWQPNMATVLVGVKELRARGKGWEELADMPGNIKATVETPRGSVTLNPGDWVVTVPGVGYQVVANADFVRDYTLENGGA